MLSVAVYCGSSPSISPHFHSEAQDLGQRLAKCGYQLVYGGANVGLMGTIADAALESGGRVIGVVPELDFAQNIVHPGLSETVRVKSLWERKQMMIDRSDAMIAFPGGLGTLDEVTDALVLRATNEISKPVFFLNLFDYWTPFLEALTVMAESRMIQTSFEQLFIVEDRVDGLMTHLARVNRVGDHGQATFQ